jgi:hypothetical protein
MAKLTAAKRNKLSAPTFAGPDRSYPIPDASHARNALARASQHASATLKAKIRAKVHRKFPGIKQHDESGMKMDGGAVRPRMDRAPRKS